MNFSYTYKLNGYFLELSKEKLHKAWVDMILMHGFLILLRILFKPIGFLCSIIVFVSTFFNWYDIIRLCVSVLSLLSTIGIKIDKKHAAIVLKNSIIKLAVTFGIIQMIKLFILLA